MEYKVKVTDTIDWNKVEKAHISSYTWGGICSARACRRQGLCLENALQ